MYDIAASIAEGPATLSSIYPNDSVLQAYSNIWVGDGRGEGFFVLTADDVRCSPPILYSDNGNDTK